MKYNYLCSLVFSVLVFALLLSCKTPPPPQVVEVEVVREVRVPVQVQVPSPPDTLMPLTGSILQRLSESTGNISNDIRRYQFILFGRIVLEREYTESNDGLMEDGTARFENKHVRESITINDQTEGQAMAIGTVGNETVLAVCFEDNDDLRLYFSVPTVNINDYFYLVYTGNGLSSTSDERGLLEYGGNIYKLKYTGERSPYLLIRLSQRDTDTLTSHTAPGRSVRAGTNSSEFE